jgi:GTPase
MLFSRTAMVATETPLVLTKTFTADILLTRGTTVTVQMGRFEPVLHILNQKLSARMLDIRSKGQTGSDIGVNDAPCVIRQGDRATVTFGLKNKSAYLRPGMRIIIREGHVIGYGVVAALL